MSAPAAWSCVTLCDWPRCPAVAKIRLVFAEGTLWSCQHHGNEVAPSLLALESFRHASLVDGAAAEEGQAVLQLS